MGCIVKVKGKRKWLSRGKLVSFRYKAAWYVSPSSAMVLVERWKDTHPEIELEIRDWLTNEIAEYRPHKKQNRRT